jgi:gliding motility-associated-like protein
LYPALITNLKRAAIFIVLMLGACGKINAQSFYVATGFYELKKATLINNNITTVDVGGCKLGNFFSIAVAGSKLYYFDSLGGLYTADIIDGQTPVLTNCRLIAPYIFSNALTVDKSGIVYYVVFSDLYSYNPATATETYLGAIPYSSSGDLVFYNNELYMASGYGIVKVSISYPESSYLYIPTNNSGFGLTTIVVNGIKKLYSLTGNMNDYSLTDVVEMDMENRREKGVVGQLPYVAYDAGSGEEVGDIPVITITDIKVNQKCEVFNKAKVEVLIPAHANSYTFELSTGEANTTGVFDNVVPGNYKVIIRSNGNESPGIQIFTVPDYTIAGLTITSINVNAGCGTKGSIKLDAGGNNATYKIKYNNQIYNFDHMFAGLDQGNYIFTIIKPDGCVADEKTINIIEDSCPPIVITDVLTQPECDVYRTASVKVVTPAHAAPYTYALNGVTNITGEFDHVAPGTYNLLVISTSGEQLARQVMVPDYSLNNPVISVTKVNALCNKFGQMKLDIGARSTDYKIKFNGQVFGFDHTFTELPAATYHFTILNLEGCIVDEKDYTIDQDSCPLIAITNIQMQPECDLYHATSVSVITAQHPDDYTYTFNGVTNTTGIFNNVLPGIYALVITSSGGDRKEQQVSVTDFTLNNPPVTAVTNNPVCDIKGQIKLDAGTSNANYRVRFNGQLFQLDHTYTDLDAGSYHFTVVNLNGCIIDEKDYVLTLDECPLINIAGINTTAECDVWGKAIVTITTTAHPDSYTYALAGVINTTGVFYNVEPGVATLTVISSGGDRKEQMFTVPDYKIVNKPALQVVVTNVVCTLGGSVTFSSTGNLHGASIIKYDAGTYRIGQPITGLSKGIKHFIILSSAGCILDEIDVNVDQDKCEPVTFPNTFTPNGDGVNDIFRPNQNSNPLNYRLTIFNRQGQQVFQSASAFIGWDGITNGSNALSGVYYWIAKYTMPDGKTEMIKGWLTLLR